MHDMTQEESLRTLIQDLNNEQARESVHPARLAGICNALLELTVCAFDSLQKDLSQLVLGTEGDSKDNAILKDLRQDIAALQAETTKFRDIFFPNLYDRISGISDDITASESTLSQRIDGIGQSLISLEERSQMSLCDSDDIIVTNTGDEDFLLITDQAKNNIIDSAVNKASGTLASKQQLEQLKTQFSNTITRIDDLEKVDNYSKQEIDNLLNTLRTTHKKDTASIQSDVADLTNNVGELIPTVITVDDWLQIISVEFAGTPVSLDSRTSLDSQPHIFRYIPPFMIFSSSTALPAWVKLRKWISRLSENILPVAPLMIKSGDTEPTYGHVMLYPISYDNQTKTLRFSPIFDAGHGVWFDPVIELLEGDSFYLKFLPRTLSLKMLLKLQTYVSIDLYKGDNESDPLKFRQYPCNIRITYKNDIIEQLLTSASAFRIHSENRNPERSQLTVPVNEIVYDTKAPFLPQRIIADRIFFSLGPLYFVTEFHNDEENGVRVAEIEWYNN